VFGVALAADVIFVVILVAQVSRVPPLFPVPLHWLTRTGIAGLILEAVATEQTGCRAATGHRAIALGDSGIGCACGERVADQWVAGAEVEAAATTCANALVHRRGRNRLSARRVCAYVVRYRDPAGDQWRCGVIVPTRCTG